jgi:hypothetical protein
MISAWVIPPLLLLWIGSTWLLRAVAKSEDQEHRRYVDYIITQHKTEISRLLKNVSDLKRIHDRDMAEMTALAWRAANLSRSLLRMLRDDKPTNTSIN